MPLYDLEAILITSMRSLKISSVRLVFPVVGLQGMRLPNVNAFGTIVVRLKVYVSLDIRRIEDIVDLLSAVVRPSGNLS